jgi:hypothetical protein
MDSNERISRRLDQLESRFEIAGLVSSYAVACDDHDMPRLTSLFTDDAEFSTQNGVMVASGRSAIVAMFIEVFRARGPSCHWTHDHFLEFDPLDADRAAGIVLGHTETSTVNRVDLSAMRYHDEYLRTDGRWRFRKRTLNFLYCVPATEFATGLTSPLRVALRGRRLAADYPESLECWQAFQRGQLPAAGAA